MEKLDLAIRTLFQEFQESALKRSQLEGSLSQKETFAKKRVKGKEYWYLQHYEKGIAVQKYFGPSNEENNRLVIEQRKKAKETQTILKELIQDEKRRAAMLKRGGLPSLESTTTSIITTLSHAKIIDQEGMLIGSYAFQAYSGMLGYLFKKESLKTIDIDIVRDPLIQVVSKTIDIRELFKKMGKTFRDVPGLSPKTLPSSFIGSEGLRIDFVTPLRGREKDFVPVPGIMNAGAHPLRFLDFLIENPVHTILIGTEGGIPVTIPQPTRFAIHKLITSIYRPAHEAAKREKDILQASQLIEVCAKEQPFELSQAYKEALSRGKKWKAALNKALKLSPSLDGLSLLR